MEFYTTIQNVMDLYYVDLTQLEQNFTKFFFPSWFLASMKHQPHSFCIFRSEQAVRLFEAYTHCCFLLTHTIKVVFPCPTALADPHLASLTPALDAELAPS